MTRRAKTALLLITALLMVGLATILLFTNLFDNDATTEVIRMKDNPAEELNHGDIRSQWADGYNEDVVRANPDYHFTNSQGIPVSDQWVPVREDQQVNISAPNVNYNNGDLDATINFTRYTFPEVTYWHFMTNQAPSESTSESFRVHVGDELEFEGYRIKVTYIYHVTGGSTSRFVGWELLEYPEDAVYFIPGQPETEPTQSEE